MIFFGPLNLCNYVLPVVMQCMIFFCGTSVLAGCFFKITHPPQMSNGPPLSLLHKHCLQHVIPGKPQLPTCSSDKLGEVQSCICPRVSVFALLSVPPM